MATQTSTDCRSYEGVTVGLIDSIITACRVLAVRGLYGDAVCEALRDLRSDHDVRQIIFGSSETSPDDAKMAQLHERVELSRNPDRSREQEERLRELDEFAASLPTARSPGAQSFEELLMALARDVGTVHRS